MGYLFIKFFLSATIVVAVSELAKRSSWIGALTASLPLTSILAMCWLYKETKDVDKIAQLSTDILWLVIPSLTLFVSLPIFLRRGFAFPWSLSLSCLITAMAYFIFYKLKSVT